MPSGLTLPHPLALTTARRIPLPGLQASSTLLGSWAPQLIQGHQLSVTEARILCLTPPLSAFLIL